MKIKKNDNVVIITGKDKGKKGKVVKAFPKMDMVLIEGVNLKKKHQKSTKGSGKGQIIEMSHPVHVSNVKISNSDK